MVIKRSTALILGKKMIVSVRSGLVAHQVSVKQHYIFVRPSFLLSISILNS